MDVGVVVGVLVRVGVFVSVGVAGTLINPASMDEMLMTFDAMVKMSVKPVSMPVGFISLSVRSLPIFLGAKAAPNGSTTRTR